jgi:hypothetical protein
LRQNGANDAESAQNTANAADSGRFRSPEAAQADLLAQNGPYRGCGPEISPNGPQNATFQAYGPSWSTQAAHAAPDGHCAASTSPGCLHSSLRGRTEGSLMAFKYGNLVERTPVTARPSAKTAAKSKLLKAAKKNIPTKGSSRAKMPLSKAEKARRLMMEENKRRGRS